ncbi:MAG: HAMP domain-containing protein [Bryobacteraceae bacterium]|jgi:nitrogen fixation/metabolism regulation signal transduction histidine kinase
MKPTIRNKLVAGFSGVLLLMAAVAGIGMYSVFRLRHSAQDATRVGGQLNAVALEIQVHNLEAQRRIKGYLTDVKTIGAARAREMYLDEAAFEIHEIGTLADRAVAIAPDAEKRAKFQKIASSVASYEKALGRAVEASEKGHTDAEAAAADAAYDTSAEQLHENAEDGEAAGRDAAQTSQDDITRTSRKAVWFSVGVSLLGLLVGSTMSYTLARAILTPVDHLKEVAESVSMGNLDVSVKRYSEDEIGDLADSFSRMVAAVKYFRLEMESTEQSPAAAQDL